MSLFGHRPERGQHAPYSPTEIGLANGTRLDLAAPHPSLIDLRALSEQLAKTARFAGATPGVFYSVAQHCVEAMRLLPAGASDRLRMLVLIHDLHEGPAEDLATPAKHAAGIEAPWKALTDHLDWAIYRAIGIEAPTWEERNQIKRIDRIALGVEYIDLMHPDLPPPVDPAELPAPRAVIRAMPWEAAQDLFLRTFIDLAQRMPELNGPATRRLLNP